MTKGSKSPRGSSDRPGMRSASATSSQQCCRGAGERSSGDYRRKVRDISSSSSLGTV